MGLVLQPQAPHPEAISLQSGLTNRNDWKRQVFTKDVPTLLPNVAQSKWRRASRYAFDSVIEESVVDFADVHGIFSKVDVLPATFVVRMMPLQAHASRLRLSHFHR